MQHLTLGRLMLEASFYPEAEQMAHTLGTDHPYQDSVVAHRLSLYDHFPAFRGQSGAPPR
jgi:hypothetical protein